MSEKVKDIDLIRWACSVGFADGSELEYDGYAPYGEIEEDASSNVGEGADAILEKARGTKGGSFVVVKCRITSTPGSKWKAQSAVKSEKALEAVRSCFKQCVARARFAEKRRVLEPMPTSSEKAKEFLSTCGEVLGGLKKGKAIVKGGEAFLGVKRAMDGAQAAAQGVAQAGAAGAEAAQGLAAFGPIIEMAMNAMKTPGVQEMVAELMEDPSQIASMLGGMADTGEGE